MQGTVQSYVLYMADDKKKEPLKVKQYDTNSRWAKITLKAFDGEYWLIPFDAQIYINVLKTDGTLATATCTKVDEHTALVPITEQMTAVPGTQLGELYFLGADGDIKSQTFPVAVYPMVMDQARIESSDDFQSLQEALRDVKVSTEAADNAAQYATEQGNAAGMAAQRAEDAADSIQVAVDAAANAKACESNAKDSELAAAQTQQEVTDYIEAQKAAFVGYSKRESDSKYANAITATAGGEGGVTVEDAWTAPVLGLDVVGKSEQATTTGAQLLPQPQFNDTKNGITVKTQMDGGISITGTATSAIAFTVAEILLPAGTYILSGLSGLVVGRMYFQLVEISAQGGQFVGELAKVGPVASATVTIDRDVWARAEIKVLSGVTADSVCYPMLNFGDTALPWEPYSGGAPSPSPDYPQDIISTGTVSTGAQLLDLDRVPDRIDNNVTSYKYIDGGLTCIFSEKNYGVRFKVSLQPNTVYTISASDISTGGYLSISDFLQTDKSGISVLVSKGQNSKTFNSETATELTFTIYSADVNYLTVTAKSIMLNAGDTALPWEPYTGGKPAPSVEYPQTLNIYSFTGNRNLLKKSGNPITTNSYMMKQYNFGDIKPLNGEKYTIQIKGILGNGKSEISIFNSGGYVFETSLYPENRDSNGIYKKSFTWKSKNDAYIADDTFIYVYAVPGSVDVESTIEWIKLEKGELATPWVPAPEDITSENAEQYSDIIRTAFITLTEPLRGIGDYRDRIMCRDGVWGVERWFIPLILDGSEDEDWGTQASTTPEKKRFVTRLLNAIVKRPKDSSELPQIMCSHFSAQTALSGHMLDQGISVDPDGKILITSEALSKLTVDEFRSWLQVNTIYAIFERATPTWEPLPDATQQTLNELTTYSGTTHLTITAGGTTPSVTLDYVKDTHKALLQCQEAAREYTDNQIAAIVAALPTATQAAIVDTQTSTLLKEVERL